MKTKQILIAIFFVPIVLGAALHAQPRRMRGFGMGLTYSDSGELIAYIARESPLHDFNIDQGDKIVAFGGKPISATTNLASELDASETVYVEIRRASKGDTFSATISKTLLRKNKVDCCGMLDPATAYVRITAFGDSNIEVLESMLDSLAKGSEGYGESTDQRVDRFAEAEGYILRESGYRRPEYDPLGNPDSPDQVAAFQAAVDSYIQNKYGWQMQTLMLDMRGNPSDFSTEVLRSVRLFCNEHKIGLVREF